MSLSQLCAPVGVGERGTSSVGNLDRSNKDDEIYQNENTINVEEHVSNNDTNQSNLKTEKYEVLNIISDTLDNSFVVLNLSPNSEDPKTKTLERSFSKKLRRTKSKKAQINKAIATQNKPLIVENQRGEFDNILKL